jgi:hypothetical protein
MRGYDEKCDPPPIDEVNKSLSAELCPGAECPGCYYARPKPGADPVVYVETIGGTPKRWINEKPTERHSCDNGSSSVVVVVLIVALTRWIRH